jgi:indolepyruvate ferredoxin oxidoreductase alpha subunit
VKKGVPYKVNHEACVECGICIEDLGCPAMGKPNGNPEILNSCFGCGVCAQVCPAGAIEEVKE